MALRLEFFNSVDGSTRFRALMGWFRFVCSNGLIIGITCSDIRKRHIGDLHLEDVNAVLTSGLEEFKTEKENFKRWRNVVINPNQITSWVDNELQKGWGFKAAARAYHIMRFGSDAEIGEQFKSKTPTTICMKKTNPVPGTPDQCRNLFDLSQILAWLAKERRDVQEQLEWREKIPELINPLISQYSI